MIRRDSLGQAPSVSPPRSPKLERSRPTSRPRSLSNPRPPSSLLGTKYHIAGPRDVKISHIEDVLGPLHEKLGSQQLDHLKGRLGLKDREHIRPDHTLDTMSFIQLGNLMQEKKDLVVQEEFENINSTFKSCPAKIVTPRDKHELQATIKQAYAQRQRVRVVGAGHSWNPVFPEDDSVMIKMENFTGITKDFSMAGEWTATFGVGMKIKEVDRFLAGVGACITTNVVMNHVGFGGLIGMGCHGTGWNEKTVSDLCVGMKLVDGKGNLREFSKKGDGDRVWNALLVNLGLFGVVYEYTVRVRPMLHVLARDAKHESKEYFGEGGEENLRRLVQKCHSTQFLWIPFTTQVFVKTFEVTDRPVNVTRRKILFDTFTNWVSMHFGSKALDDIPDIAKLTPLFLKSGFATLPKNYERIEPLPNAIHWEQFLDALAIHCMEFALPINENDPQDFIKIGECVRFVQRRVAEEAAKGKYPMNLSLEMRFTSASDALISPAQGKDHVCYIEIVTTVDTSEWKPFSIEVAEAWLKIFPDAKPHWAKECFHIPGIEKLIQKQYGPKLIEFLDIRKELDVDPQDMFYTEWLGSIFDPNHYAQFVANRNSSENNTRLDERCKCTIM
eukprot:TRINITY_DN17127_c0_g1_i1.p1 TRINITY_DN17127_c0_g1~~TRINITY_DN17127_c0_g1_i1.p1  ORF type:complete len:613 (-),score=149.19 TRINITY_DN17127_c0_g1_i1:46-1884(-)